MKRAVEEEFGAAFGYEIREGERSTAHEVLNNQEAAQLLMAVYQRQPWNAVRKVRLFDTDYRTIFDRDVTASRLYLLKQISKALQGRREALRSDLAASFASIRFTLAYLLGAVLRESEAGCGLLDGPHLWLPGATHEVGAKLDAILGEIVDSVNFYIEEEERDSPDFDPKVTFKSQAGVQGIENAVIRDYRRLIKRDKSYLFDLEAPSED